MVGLQTLTLPVGVRIPVSQLLIPKTSTARNDRHSSYFWDSVRKAAGD
jgi:hypothetical protein